MAAPGTGSPQSAGMDRCGDSIVGPYLDREGKPMLEGGGTPLVPPTDRWRGPGHNAVFREGDADWLLYHAYDAEENGAPKLRVEKLGWDDAGWPAVKGPLTLPGAG